MTELYSVNNNGQLEINFDSLELITNVEFVKQVKNSIKYGEELLSVEVQSQHVTVVTGDSKFITINEFFRAGEFEKVTSLCISVDQLAQSGFVRKEVL